MALRGGKPVLKNKVRRTLLLMMTQSLNLTLTDIAVTVIVLNSMVVHIQTFSVRIFFAASRNYYY